VKLIIISLFYYFKSVISGRDVTFSIRALFSKRFLGCMGSELTVFRLRDYFELCLLFFAV